MTDRTHRTQVVIYRNGERDRTLDTRLGSLQFPNGMAGYFPLVLEAFKTSVGA